MIRIFNLTKGRTLATNARIALSPSERLMGLLAEDSFPAGSGLWIVPANRIHSNGMKFPIDILFLDPRRRIMEVVELPIGAEVSNPYAYSVVELPVGIAKFSESEPGDQLEFRGN